MTEMTTKEKLAKLREPFSSKDIEWRVGATNKDKTQGQALPYLTFRAVAERLDDIFGPENWKPEFAPGAAGGVLCRLSIRIESEWIAKENGAENTDMEAIKGGLTDAFKRAAAMWGVGRYLYAYQAPWVKLENNRRLTTIPVLPDWALPEDERGQIKPEQNEAAGDSTQTTEESGSATAVANTTAPSTATHASDSAEGTEAAANDSMSNSSNQSEGLGAKAGEDASNGKKNDEVDLLAGLPEGLPAGDVDKIKNILARAQKDVAVAVLKNYVNTKAVMSDTAKQFVNAKLDSLAA